MINIVFVRHGETPYNVTKNLQGQTDVELSDNGKLQAETLGKYVSDEEFTRVYSSDLKRALKTAQLILAQSNVTHNNIVPIVTDKRLRERDYGEYEGVQLSKLREHGDDFTPKGAETIEEFSERIQSFFNVLLELDNGKYENILVVTHGGWLKTLLKYVVTKIKNMTIEGKTDFEIYCANCCVTRITIVKTDSTIQRRFIINSLYDVSHFKNNIQ